MDVYESEHSQSFATRSDLVHSGAASPLALSKVALDHVPRHSRYHYAPANPFD